MNTSNLIESEASARALALILSADGSLSDGSMRKLDRLEAFDLLGVSSRRFVELAHQCGSEVDPGLSGRSWLSERDIAQAESCIDGVHTPEQRLLVCRLGAAAIENGGLVTHGARLVLDHVLARWHIDPSSASPGHRLACGN